MKSNRYREYVSQQDNEIGACNNASLTWEKKSKREDSKAEGF